MAQRSLPAEPTRPWWRSVAWPALVVVLLVGHCVLITGALVLSSVLIPGAWTAIDGYENALAWDEEQELRRASERLGWSLEVLVDEKAELNGGRRVSFLLKDAAGEAITNAVLKVKLYHHARADQVIERQLARVEDAESYTALLPMKRSGAWKIRAVATRDNEEFIVEQELWLPEQGGVSS